MDHETLTRVVLAAVRARAHGFPGDVGLDTPLGPEGAGIDSIGCLELVLDLEEQTGFRLRDEMLTADVLATPRSLVEHLVGLARTSHG